MSYTKDQLDRFRELVELGESPRQMDRINSRMEMPEFIELVGRETCEEMFEVLKRELKEQPK